MVLHSHYEELTTMANKFYDWEPPYIQYLLHHSLPVFAFKREGEGGCNKAPRAKRPAATQELCFPIHSYIDYCCFYTRINDGFDDIKQPLTPD